MFGLQELCVVGHSCLLDCVIPVFLFFGSVFLHFPLTFSYRLRRLPVLFGNFRCSRRRTFLLVLLVCSVHGGICRSSNTRFLRRCSTPLSLVLGTRRRFCCVSLPFLLCASSVPLVRGLGPLGGSCPLGIRCLLFLLGGRRLCCVLLL